jgi:hypothetical protein
MTTENEGGGSCRIDEVNIERADLAERAVGCASGLPPTDHYFGIGRLIFSARRA